MRKSELSLQEMLNGWRVADLRVIASAFYIDNTKKKKKAELISAVAKSLQEPGRMEEFLYIVDRSTWQLFQLAATTTGRIPVQNEDGRFPSWRMLTKFGYLHFEGDEDQGTVMMPTEIKALFASLKENGYLERKARIDLLHQYALAFVHLYGVIPFPDMVDIFNRQNSCKTNAEELFLALNRHAVIGDSYRIWDRYLVDQVFEDNNFEDVPDLLRQQKGKPRYVPEKAALLRYSDEMYFEATQHTASMKAFIRSAMGVTQELADEIVAEIVSFAQVDMPLQKTFQIFDDHDITVDDDSFASLTDHIVNIRNTTRLWSNCGHTPKEMAAMLYERPYGAMMPATPKIRIGRNDPCPCGSGKKYKKCCGR